MKPEERARVKIDKQLNNAGWEIVSRNEYVPNSTLVVKEAIMRGNIESDYLLFIEDKAIAVVEAKKEDNPLGENVKKQAEDYAVNPQPWYGLWFDNLIPLVYMANGNKIYYKNMLVPDSEYEELTEMHSPKKMLQLIGKKSEFGALPLLEKQGLRECQYKAEINLEKSLKSGNKKNLAILATGSGKTYLACLASYRMLNYTATKRVLFLVDRNNLARQTESEFNLFDRTEKQQSLSELYKINRLRKESDIKGDIVISTIQKLFAVLTGQALSDDNEDTEDENAKRAEEKELEEVVQLGSDLKLPSDYFQLIVVDECHRSIYGKWKAVLDYFSGAKVLGLTATPTPEAYSYFNNNVIEKYTYDDSVVDGVNVPSRVYRITTEVTEHGGTIEAGTEIIEAPKGKSETTTYAVTNTIEYAPTQLDRSVINRNQMKTVLTAYKNAIYTELYPEREVKWEYIPKTLIFAKDDNHATEIVNVAKKVFGSEFENGEVPENYVKKITYSSGDSNALIRDFRIEKDFRIAVTVTLVATGTDVRPLEVVLFMKDVQSDVLYTQMKGRGCNFLQHIMSIVKPEGRVAVVLPDNVLTDGNATAKVRERLLKGFNLHTILRLPTGIFYAGGVKTNVLFFEKGKETKDIWVYDYRTGIKHTMATKPMTRAHLDDFVECYCSGHMKDRKQTYSEENPNGRWRKFTAEEVYSREQLKLDFKWIDLEEKDDRTVTELLSDMEDKATAIAGAISKLQEILGGIEL